MGERRIKYSYDGPVFDEFTMCIESNWVEETWAVSTTQALNNLRNCYRKEHGLDKKMIIDLDPHNLYHMENGKTVHS